jgi:hypothetical protein
MVAPTSTIAPPSRLSARQLVGDQLEGVLHREGLDIDHLGRQPPSSSAATRRSTFSVREAASRTLISSRVVLDRPEHLEVEADFLDRVRNVLVRFHLDLVFQVVLAQIGRHRDHLGDDRRAGHRGGGELGAWPERAGPRA